MLHDMLYWWFGPLGAALALYFLWDDIKPVLEPHKRKKWINK